jgi:hypothetical protein
MKHRRRAGLRELTDHQLLAASRSITRAPKARDRGSENLYFSEISQDFFAGREIFCIQAPFSGRRRRWAAWRARLCGVLLHNRHNPTGTSL